MKRLGVLITFSLLLLTSVGKINAFRPETFANLVVPVHEYSDPIRGGSTLDNVDLIYTLSTPSALPITWLIGYDSLGATASAEYFDILASLPNQELGLRLELNSGLVNKAAPGANRSNFDQLSNKLLLGYSQVHRQALIDEMMSRFFDVFGFYPRTVADAYIDSFSLGYLADKYSVQAAISLGDQKINFVNAYHPDTPINGWQPPYYPTKTNALIPASDVKEKTPIVQLSLNPATPGQTSRLILESLSEDQLIKYFEYWGQKDFNEFTQVAFGTTNLLELSQTKEFYEMLFETLYDLREKLSLAPATAAEFSDWFMARYPLTSPAYFFAADNAASYFNPFYRASLRGVNGKLKLEEVVWYTPYSSEPYWHQSLMESELELPIYNLLASSDAAWLKEKPQKEYWDLELKTASGRLRFEPEKIISSDRLSWVDPQLAVETKSGNDFVYSSTENLPLARHFAGGKSLLILLTLLAVATIWNQKQK